MQTPNVVRTLWHGSALSIFEELSLRSFLKCGHEVEVYSYQDLALPQGVRLCDANTVLPASDVFSYNSGLAKGSFAAFSNLFRFKMLYQKGGIWADSDVLCLKSLADLPGACAGRVTDKWLNGAILRFPAGHPFCLDLSEKLADLGTDLYLGQTSELITQVAGVYKDQLHLLPMTAFYPFHSKQTWKLLDPDQLRSCEEASKDSYCVHWWNAVLTLAIDLPKNALPPEGSFLYNRALEVFGAPKLNAWPIEVLEPCIKNQKMSSYAEDASRAKDWPEAIRRWEAVMAAFGDKATADMWVYAAQAHRNNGTLEMAEDVVNLALSHYPSNYRLAREKAELMLAKGDWAQAAKHWQALLDHFPDRSSGRDLARISKRLRENGEIYSAEALTARGMAVHSDDLDLSKEFAEVATAQKKWPEAIERWRVVLRAQGDSAPARVYFRLGQSLRRNGNIDSACSVVRQGMAIWPDDASLVKELDHLASISRTA